MILEWRLKEAKRILGYYDGTESNCILHIDECAACILHLENRCGIKIMDSVVREGLRDVTISHGKESRRIQFCKRVKDELNHIIGMEYHPGNWKLHYCTK